MSQYSHLKRVSTYAKAQGCSTQNIYLKVQFDVMELVEIDGVLFVDTKKYPSIPKTPTKQQRINKKDSRR